MAGNYRGEKVVWLNTSESKIVNVKFIVPAEELSFWDVKTKPFIVVPDDFEVMIGSSSSDIKSSGYLTVNFFNLSSHVLEFCI